MSSWGSYGACMRQNRTASCQVGVARSALTVLYRTSQLRVPPVGVCMTLARSAASSQHSTYSTRTHSRVASTMAPSWRAHTPWLLLLLLSLHCTQVAPACTCA
jgi:hypothetical protein